MDINPVKLEDDASYQCQVGAAQGVAPIRSDVSFQSKDIPTKKLSQIYLTAFFQNAYLTVTVPPEPPIILNGNRIKTTETRKVKVKCSSRGGKPAAEVKILI